MPGSASAAKRRSWSTRAEVSGCDTRLRGLGRWLGGEGYVIDRRALAEQRLERRQHVRQANRDDLPASEANRRCAALQQGLPEARLQAGIGVDPARGQAGVVDQGRDAQLLALPADAAGVEPPLAEDVEQERRLPGALERVIHRDHAGSAAE